MAKIIKKDNEWKPSRKMIRQKLLKYFDPSKRNMKYRSYVNLADDYYNSCIENNEKFEKLLSDWILLHSPYKKIKGSGYNHNQTGLDAILPINGQLRNVEMKRPRNNDTGSNGTMRWSFHEEVSRLALINENLALILSGTFNGQLAYIILVEFVNDTEILKERDSFSLSKVTCSWSSIKEAKSDLLYINRNLVTKFTTPEFRNFLLNKDETCKQMLGFSIRDSLGLDNDQKRLYYKKNGTVSSIADFSIGNTCFEISKKNWDKIKKIAIKLSTNQEKSLQIGKNTLYIRNKDGQISIRSSIDDTKTKYRDIDLTQTI